jgi:hypothetical protein
MIVITKSPGRYAWGFFCAVGTFSGWLSCWLGRGVGGVMGLFTDPDFQQDDIDGWAGRFYCHFMVG